MLWPTTLGEHEAATGQRSTRRPCHPLCVLAPLGEACSRSNGPSSSFQRGLPETPLASIATCVPPAVISHSARARMSVLMVEQNRMVFRHSPAAFTRNTDATMHMWWSAGPHHDRCTRSIVSSTSISRGESPGSHRHQQQQHPATHVSARSCRVVNGCVIGLSHYAQRCGHRLFCLQPGSLQYADPMQWHPGATTGTDRDHENRPGFSASAATQGQAHSAGTVKRWQWQTQGPPGQSRPGQSLGSLRDDSSLLGQASLSDFSIAAHSSAQLPPCCASCGKSEQAGTDQAHRLWPSRISPLPRRVLHTLQDENI